MTDTWSYLLFAQSIIRPGLVSSPGQGTVGFESEVEIQGRTACGVANTQDAAEYEKLVDGRFGLGEVPTRAVPSP